MPHVPTETRELAYQAWRDCGQNLSETHRRLNSEEMGYVISRQSLHEWKTKYDWEGRAARAEAEEKHLADATSDEALLVTLLKQKKKYEGYFDVLELGKVDNQAVYGYNSILKMILEIRTKSAKSIADEVAGEAKALGFSDERVEAIYQKILFGTRG